MPRHPSFEFGGPARRSEGTTRVSFVSFSRNAQANTKDCSIFERALDALPDGVLLVNADRKVVYTNAAFKRLWSVPDTILSSRDDEANLQYVMGQIADPEGFRREVERLHPTTETSQDEVLLKDGRTIARRSLPFEEQGSFQARIWIFTDVTEAKNAGIDQLTGLANRRAYARDFPAFVSAPPDGLVRSVAIIDIDNFKRYNDCYGHAAGDAILGDIGALLKSYALRTGDLVFRIGGEEFLMAARTRTSGEARALFESVRRAVTAMSREHAGNPPHDIVTISAGFQSFRQESDPGALFRTVDELLYQAKAAGRNKVVEAKA